MLRLRLCMTHLLGMSDYYSVKTVINHKPINYKPKAHTTSHFALPTSDYFRCLPIVRPGVTLVVVVVPSGTSLGTSLGSGKESRLGAGAAERILASALFFRNLSIRLAFVMRS